MADTQPFDVDQWEMDHAFDLLDEDGPRMSAHSSFGILCQPFDPLSSLMAAPELAEKNVVPKSSKRKLFVDEMDDELPDISGKNYPSPHTLPFSLKTVECDRSLHCISFGE